MTTEKHQVTSKVWNNRRERRIIFSGLDTISLGPQLVLLVLVTALPLLGLALFMSSQVVDLGRENIRASLLNSARTLAALADNEIDTHSAIATTLAQSNALRRGELGAFWRQSKKALEAVPGAWLELKNASNQPILNTLSEPMPLSVGPRDFAEPSQLSPGEVQVSDIIVDPTTKRRAAILIVPLLREGSPVYTITIGLSPDRFLRLIENKFGGGELVGILDKQRNFVARIPDNAERVGTPASDGWREAIARAPEGLTENRTLEGDWAVTAYAPSAIGWTAGISYKLNALNAPIQQLLWTLGALGVVLTLASLVLAFVLGRRFASSMRTLTSLAGSVGDEVLEPPKLAFREATEIGRGLSEVSRKLKTQTAALSNFNAELEGRVAQRTSELMSEVERREESEERLRQIQRMESLGQLTGGIAHDFNNMLAIVLGCLDILQRRLERGDLNVYSFIDGARQGAERAATLTKRLLAFSRRQALSPQPVDPNKLIIDMSDLLRRTIPESIKMETVLAGGLWRVNADAGEIENALINLANNARDDEYASTQPGLSPGQYVMIAVTDNGPGMPPDVVAKAFDPFFTTKAPGRGTGLGLSQVYGFIKQSGGHVKIYSEVGHGVTVKLYLPRFFGAGEPATADRQGTRALVTSQANECVLVVEDDPAVLKLTTGMLIELGYRPLAAASGAQALELLDANDDVRLLLTDIVMPDMNGRKLAQAALQRHPGLVVLYTTGYTRNAIVHNGIVDPDVELIMKPFSLEALAQKVSRVLRGQNRPNQRRI
jgi:signal transduction histidine kinase/CheY-like chemotaxis protein